MRPNRSANIDAASAAANSLGAVIPASQVFAASVQAVVTGTSTGTLNVQVSNDAAGAVDSSGNAVITNWSMPSGITVAVAGAGVYLIPKFDCCYQWMRLQFVSGNGAAGTITGSVNTQAI